MLSNNVPDEEVSAVFQKLEAVGEDPLTADTSAFDKRLTESTFEGMRVLTVNADGSYDSVAFYIHGGYYVYQLSNDHITMMNRIANATNAMLVMPLYPLAPLHDTADSYETMVSLFAQVCRDNEAAAREISAEVGISDVRANLLPEDKMHIIKGYAGGSELVCMVGDGVNDALALSAADAGVAMGGIGSDIAIESADAVLVSDEIKRLPYLFSLTRKVMQTVKVNIIASLIINITAVVLSAMGVLTPVTGALWHNCSSVFVVVNAALLLRLKDEN